MIWRITRRVYSYFKEKKWKKILDSKIDETRSSVIEEINQNEFTIKKHKKGCTSLNYIENLRIVASTVTECVSISAFASLVGIPVFAVGLKICAITAGTKKCKSIIKKKRKRHDEIVLLAKTKSNTIEVLISRALVDSCISHKKYVLINNMLKEYDGLLMVLLK